MTCVCAHLLCNSSERLHIQFICNVAKQRLSTLTAAFLVPCNHKAHMHVPMVWHFSQQGLPCSCCSFCPFCTICAHASFFSFSSGFFSPFLDAVQIGSFKILQRTLHTTELSAQCSILGLSLQSTRTHSATSSPTDQSSPLPAHLQTQWAARHAHGRC